MAITSSSWAMDNEAQEQFYVASIKDQLASACSVVVKRWILGAGDREALTSAVGRPEAFAAKHHGQLVC